MPMLSDLDKMRMGTDYKFPVRLRDYEFWCRPLTVLETTEVAIETANDLKKKEHLRHVPLAESVLFAIKTISRASSPGPDKPIALQESVLQQLTPDELMFLFAEYNAVVARVAPQFEDVSNERIEELMKLAKKNPGALTDCSFAEVVGLCRHLSELVPQDKSSGG